MRGSGIVGRFDNYFETFEFFWVCVIFVLIMNVSVVIPEQLDYNLWNSGQEKVNFLQNHWHTWPQTTLQFWVKYFFNKSAFIFGEELNFESTNSCWSELCINNSWLIRLFFSSEVLNLFIIIGGDRFNNHKNLWELFSDRGLDVISKCMVFVFIMLSRDLVIMAVDTK